MSPPVKDLEGAHTCALVALAETRRMLAEAKRDASLLSEAGAKLAEALDRVEKARRLVPSTPLLSTVRSLTAALVETRDAWEGDERLVRLFEERLEREQARESELSLELSAAYREAPRTPSAPPTRHSAAAHLRLAAEGVTRNGYDYTAADVAILLSTLARELERGEPIPSP